MLASIEKNAPGNLIFPLKCFRFSILFIPVLALSLGFGLGIDESRANDTGHLSIGITIKGNTAQAGGTEDSGVHENKIGEVSSDDAPVEPQTTDAKKTEAAVPPVEAGALDLEKMKTNIHKLKTDYSDVDGQIRRLETRKQTILKEKKQIAANIQNEINRLNHQSNQLKEMGSKKIDEGEKLVEEGNEYFRKAQKIYKESHKAKQVLTNTNW